MSNLALTITIYHFKRKPLIRENKDDNNSDG